jgi:hypothetical protein
MLDFENVVLVAISSFITAQIIENISDRKNVVQNNQQTELH